MSCHVRSVIIHDSSQRLFSFKASHLRNAATKCPFVRSRISKGCTLMFLSRIWGACIEIKYYRWGLHAVLYVAILSPISSLVWRYCMRWWCGHKQGRPAASAPSCQGCGLANLIQIQNLEKSTNTNKYKPPRKGKTAFSQPESCWDIKFLSSLPMVGSLNVDLFFFNWTGGRGSRKRNTVYCTHKIQHGFHCWCGVGFQQN